MKTGDWRHHINHTTSKIRTTDPLQSSKEDEEKVEDLNENET